MATASQSLDHWFVKVEGKIRGPFSMSVLRSMKDRGRLGAATDVSQDRQTWFPASQVTELFGEMVPAATTVGQTSPESVPALPDQSGADQVVCRELQATPQGEAGRCFYSMDGIVHGPVSVSTLQARVTSGQLSESDYVWVEGTSDWVPASQLSLLSFAPRKQASMSWFRRSPILAICVVGMIGFLLLMPAWFVFALSSHRTEKEIQAKQKEDEIIQQALRQKKESLDRLEKERQEVLSNKRELANVQSATAIRIAETDTQLELIKLQDKRDKKREELLDKLIMKQKRQNDLMEEYSRQLRELKAQQAQVEQSGHWVAELSSCSGCGGDGKGLFGTCGRCGGSGLHTEQVWKP